MRADLDAAREVEHAGFHYESCAVASNGPSARQERPPGAREPELPANLLAAALATCALVVAPPVGAAQLTHDYSATHGAFMENLAAHCGQAFPGNQAISGGGPRDDDHLLVHFRQCDEDEIWIPFHAEDDEIEGGWDHSRTWFVMQVGEGLELRHDHREKDGSESSRTWYGGFSIGEGTANRMDFHSPERTWNARVPVGWRIEIEPGVVYRYGTTYNDEFSWMVEFDLSRPIPEDEIPEVWGHDQPPTRIPGPP